MKFNYKKGSKTKKGKIHTLRLLTPDHTLFPVFYKANGDRRTEQQIKAGLAFYKPKKELTAKEAILKSGE